MAGRKILLILLFAIVFFAILSFGLRKIVGELKPPVKGRVTSPFGNRTHPITGDQRFHNGLDIAAAHGTIVRAPAAGKVVRAYTADPGGKQLVIDHDNGFTTGYAHLSEQTVKVGDRVRRDQQIGLTGSTGKVTGPHLHFNVRNRSGKFIDPATIIPYYA